ncbi:hypothetical protein JQM97_03490 [Prevotella hominis]|uniref:hypothetical protein n=1 Tax=Segatella hominis TaxID=2518605 RepID=UPI001F3F70AD|nr:hypothetical protein [Segatella hominis]MCF2590022.1 hypothetical protein [Segatella hominis]
MATRQEVIFKGLTNSPSDYDCQDGELATCLNLINEDGALHPIHQPVVAEPNITLSNNSCSIRYVHNVTHANKNHSHYIVNCTNSSPSWYWTEKGGDGTPHELNLGNFKVNSVTAIGNIICFVGDKNILYAFWNKDSYSIFNKNAFNYTFSVTNTSGVEVDAIAQLGDDFQGCFWTPSFGSQDYDNLIFEGTKPNGTKTIWNAIDSMINKAMSENGNTYFKYLVFGVVALRLYDGTYSNISNLFVLCPKGNINNIFYYNADKETIKNTEYYKFVRASGYIHRHQINVQLDLTGIEDFVQGVDVFLTKGTDFLLLDKGYDTTSTETVNNLKKRKGTITFERLKKSALYREFDNLTFYHSIYITKEDLGKNIDLLNVQGTEESLSLADMGRTSIGSSCAIAYNNRLHLANIQNYINDIFSLNPIYKFELNSSSTSFPVEKINTILGNYMDVPLTDEGWYDYGKMNTDTAEVIAVIDNKYYYKATVQYPLNPIFVVPFQDAKSVKLYIKHKDEIGFRNINLHQSETFGMSYYIFNAENGIFSFMQKYELSNFGGVLTRMQGDTFTSTSSKFYDEASQKCDSDGAKIEQLASLIKVSEAENPLVFPAKNSVQVGSSVISALAANTRPISEGQFGEAPLYAFTDEGVWVLMLGEEGTYVARQPANREICSNPNGILQIDDAVLYPTNRGIMMQKGRNSICITDQLDGCPFNFMEMKYAKQIIATNGTGSGEISYIRFKDYLKSADMIYDYYDNRIIVFNPNQAYAYVYSLKSKMWGTMKNVFNKRVNIYPESYATNKEGKILNVYVEEQYSNTPYFLCSRPLTISDKEVYKTIFTCIARGYFRKGTNGKCAIVLYGSNNLFDWYLIKTSINEYLRGIAGSPYKYFRVALIGNLATNESISGLSAEFQERLQNKLR